MLTILQGLDIRQRDMIDFYKNQIKNNPSVELKMLHFFVDSGIKDTMYYWGEFSKASKIIY